MTVTKTEFDGLLLLDPRVFGDNRGHFFESYNFQSFTNAGVPITFVQDNQSLSSRGVLRGLHFQRPPYAQTKLVRVLSGAIRDVVLDLRAKEPTYGRHYAIELSSENKKQLLVPKGFAHGFLVLSETAEVMYKCDEYYHREQEGGIFPLDPALGINWGPNGITAIMSEKDRALPLLSAGLVKF